MLYFTKCLANYSLIPSCSAVLGCQRVNNRSSLFPVNISSKTVICSVCTFSFVRLLAYHLYKTDQMLVHERMIVCKQLRAMNTEWLSVLASIVTNCIVGVTVLGRKTPSALLSYIAQLCCQCHACRSSWCRGWGSNRGRKNLIGGSCTQQRKLVLLWSWVAGAPHSADLVILQTTLQKFMAPNIHDF